MSKKTFDGFQSTLPSQGATDFSHLLQIILLISIHAPLTGSDFDPEGLLIFCGISIHAPLTGSDPGSNILHIANDEFQSTLPSQGATVD